jgi:AcrR family transcriptional regulator
MENITPEIKNMDPEKERILKLVKEIFFREGFYKTSMDSLALRLQVSKKTFYKYWTSKEELVKESIYHQTILISGEVNTVIEKKADALSKIFSVLEILSSTLLKFSDKWLQDLQIQLPDLWREIDRFRTKKMYAILSRLLEQGKKEGLISEVPVEIMITVIVSAIRTIVNPEFLYHNKFSYIEAVYLTFDIFFRGILTSDGRKRFQPPYSRKLK